MLCYCWCQVQFFQPVIVIVVFFSSNNFRYIFCTLTNSYLFLFSGFMITEIIPCFNRALNSLVAYDAPPSIFSLSRRLTLFLCLFQLFYKIRPVYGIHLADFHGDFLLVEFYVLGLVQKIQAALINFLLGWNFILIWSKSDSNNPFLDFTLRISLVFLQEIATWWTWNSLSILFGDFHVFSLFPGFWNGVDIILRLKFWQKVMMYSPFLLVILWVVYGPVIFFPSCPLKSRCRILMWCLGILLVISFRRSWKSSIICRSFLLWLLNEF